MFYFIIFYLLIGLLTIIHNRELHPVYLILLISFTIKIIINYRKCTLSYLECKLRGVKQEEGYLNNFFNRLFDIRNEEDKVYKIVLLLSFLIIYYSIFINNNSLMKLYNNLKRFYNYYI